MYKIIEITNLKNGLKFKLETFICDEGIVLTYFEDEGIKGEFSKLKGVNQDGISINSISLSERYLNIEGIILAKSRSEIAIKKDIITRVINPKHNIEVVFKENDNSKKIIGKAEDTIKYSVDYKTNNQVALAFKVDIICPDPYWQNLEEDSTDLVIWIPNLEFPFFTEQGENHWIETGFGEGFEEFQSGFGTGQGVEFGYRLVKQIVEIDNIGDVDTPLRVIFKASADVVKPYIQDMNSYELLRINKTLKAGDKLEIVTEYGNKNIYLNGEKAHQYLDFLNSTWLQLKPGVNLIKYGAEEGINTLECRVFYTHKYLGV